MLAGRAARAGGDDQSYANVDQFRVTHVDLNLDVDFDARVLRGSATLTVHRIDPDALHLVLDVRGLNVTDVDELTDDFLGATEKLAPFWVSRPFHIGAGAPGRGGALVIDLPPTHSADETIRIEYETAPNAQGLHWGAAANPDRRQRLFFYTWSEPIGARSWIPTQDTPLVRASYRVHIHTPDDDVALMSAAATVSESGGDSPNAKRTADHWFTVTKPIPSYALDLVVGDLKFRAIDGQFGVYAEANRLSRAARALQGAAQVRSAAMQWLGMAQLPRRDLVVMPPDFPLADAETRRLTLISPTLVAGDPSLVPAAVRESIAADAADLIGFQAWRDRWIGVALGAYLQSRIVAQVFGAQAAAIADTLAWMDLRAALAASAPAQQVLAGAGTGAGAGSESERILRDKGRLFFGFLEGGFGRARFDAFLHAFIARTAGESVTTEQFLGDLDRQLLERYPGVATKRQIDAWVFDPGMPTNAPFADAQALQSEDGSMTAWLAGRSTAAGLGARGWPVEQWIYFLKSLPADLSKQRLAELDAAYSLSGVRDAEIQGIWLLRAIRSGYQPAIAHLPDYLAANGRIGLIAPLYGALEQSAGAALAQQMYSAARPGYDPAAAKVVDSILKPEKSGTP